ncbi:MAG TPA: hypothetical protein VE685_11760 [Thermoanaerobaculia bacterium]|nr:hypothetical protein [Thermoanaerobaculia bacterium]
MPKRTLITLLLLAAFSLGFVAGPHPCKTRHGEEQETRSPSCHEASGSLEGSAVRASVPSHEDGQSCCDAVCGHACHMSAAAGVRPTLLAVELVSQVVVQGSGRVPSPLAHPIDHVPLA